MAITASDIKFFLSGGTTNTVGDNSLGGAISTTQASPNPNELFDIVSGNEAAAGTTEYRCIYIKNDHPSLVLFTVRVFIATNTPSPDTTVEIALGTSALNGTEQTIANEATAPSGTSFSTAANEGAALSIGDIPAGQHKALWIKRIVSPGAAAFDADGVTIRVKGDTGE
jgi:hypothetical protein